MPASRVLLVLEKGGTRIIVVGNYDMTRLSHTQTLTMDWEHAEAAFKAGKYSAVVLNEVMIDPENEEVKVTTLKSLVKKPPPVLELNVGAKGKKPAKKSAVNIKKEAFEILFDDVGNNT